MRRARTSPTSYQRDAIYLGSIITVVVKGKEKRKNSFSHGLRFYHFSLPGYSEIHIGHARSEHNTLQTYADVARVVVTQEASFCLAGQSRWIRLMRMYVYVCNPRGAQKSFYVKWTVWPVSMRGERHARTRGVLVFQRPGWSCGRWDGMGRRVR